jgi:DnaK suppressor protein
MSTTTNDETSQSVRQMLLAERSSVVSRIDSIAKGALEVEFDGDGMPASSWGQDQALTDSLGARLKTIDDALQRLDDKTYGLCAVCGSPIAPRRLSALPFATLCVECQSHADKRNRSNAR